MNEMGNLLVSEQETLTQREKNWELHVVSHTHWDREWYASFEEFRIQLVETIDRLVDLLASQPEFKTFYLDGQTVVLQDYLAIRPDRWLVLRELIRAGRILVGPWYVASDEFLVSGESLVRNLLLGRADSRAFGEAFPVGYLPDQFGHIAQMPQILQGFGIEYAVLSRGLSRGSKCPAEFVWEGSDGSKVTVAYLPNGYSNAKRLPVDEELARMTVKEIVEKGRLHAGTRHILAMNGSDHLAPQTDLPQALDTARRVLGIPVHHTDLVSFLKAVLAENPGLPVIHGELREDDGGRLDAGTLSTRVTLKQNNSRAEWLLSRLAEPLLALAGLDATSETRMSWCGLLDYAWRLLIKNHAHDTISGCVIDKVADESVVRMGRVQQIAECLAERAMRALGCAPFSAPQDEIRVLYFYPGQKAGTRVHCLTVAFPLAAPSRRPRETVSNPDRYKEPWMIEVRDETGQPLPVQLLDCREEERLVLSADELPQAQPVVWFDIAVEADLPAFGIGSLTVRAKREGRTYAARRFFQPPTVVENDLLTVTVEFDGSLTIRDKSNGRVIMGCLRWEDVGEGGDAYHHVPVGKRGILTPTVRRVEVVESGPLLSSLTMSLDLELPKRLGANRQTRSQELVHVPIVTTITVRKGSPLVEITTKVTNCAEDHRLRVLFPSNIASDDLLCGAPFDAVKRPLDNPAEWVRAATCRPFSGWVAVCDENSATALFADGLYEIEGLRSTDGTICLALTLLRSVGGLSRRTANPTVLPIPAAQLQGEHIFRYAFLPFVTTADPVVFWQWWDQWQAKPITRETAYSTKKTSAVEVSGPLVVTALKPPALQTSPLAFDRFTSRYESPAASKPFTWVLRGFNPRDHEGQVYLRFAQPLATAYRLTLSEDVCEKLDVNENELMLRVRPKEIVTIGVAFK